MDRTLYYDNFLNPPAEFQAANYWFWQRIPTEHEIDTQLTEMLEAGFHTFFIQPRLAFPIEQYMSKDYLAAYRYAIIQASKLGLKAGIYDDYNWNSGHGGGLTVKDHDEFRERQLFWCSTTIENKSVHLEISEIKTLMGDTLGGPQGRWTYEGGVPIWGDWELTKVMAYPPSHELTTHDQLEDLTKFCKIEPQGIDRCKIQINLPDEHLSGMKVTAFISARCMSSKHMNYLNKKATSRYIEVDYEPYRQAVGEYFGSTVFCMFMDHPHAGFYTWKQKEGEIKNSLMFDECLIKSFLDEHQYPVELAWLSFLLPESKYTNKMRGDFFDTYGHLAREFFLGQISDWSHKNGLQFAGHELFSFLGVWGFYGGYHVVDQRTDFGGDYFGIGHYKDISTVDAYNSNPQIDAKIGDSVARANGTRGCLLEQYYFYANQDKPGAIGHWNLTYEEMRAQAIRHTLFGTRQFIFHGFYLADDVGGYELLSSSRFDFAPAVNFEPWFVHHRFFAREISRLSSFIYQAQPIADIAVLYPLSTFWVEETDGIFGAESAVWHQNLLENGLGFDVIEEQEIRYESSSPGYLKAGKNSYRVLVLPGVKVLKNVNTINAIYDFVRSGGHIILSGRLPEGTLDELENNTVKETFENLISQYKNVQFYPEVVNSLSTINASLRTDLNNRPMIKFPQNMSGPIWSWSGLHEASHLIALFNDGPEHCRMEMILPMVNVLIEKWDVLSGHKKEWLWFKEDQGTTSIMVDLLPGEISCFKIDPDQKQRNPIHLINSELRVLDASKEIDQVSIEVEGITPGIFNFKVNNRIETLTVPALPDVRQLKENWTFVTPYMKKPQAINIQKGWEKQGFDEYSGEGRYSTSFDLAVLSPNWHEFDWKLTFPKIISTAEIILNEQSIGFLSWFPYEILLPSRILQPDNNLLEVRVFNTGGNHYYGGSPYNVEKFPSGIVGCPSLVPVKIFTIK